MAFSDASFIRRTSPSLLRQYFARKDIVVGEEVAWDTPGTKLREALIEWMAKQPGQVRVAITLDWERVSELSDELGQDAILRAFRDDRGEIIQQFKSLKGGKDRALWLFLNKLRDFQRAEEIAFARYYRNNKRHWDGFIGSHPIRRKPRNPWPFGLRRMRTWRRTPSHPSSHPPVAPGSPESRRDPQVSRPRRVRTQVRTVAGVAQGSHVTSIACHGSARRSHSAASPSSGPSRPSGATHAPARP